MKNFNLGFAAVVIFLMPSILFAQTSKQDSIWSPFKYFVGKWNGLGAVEGKHGNYERSYQFIFNRRFIEVKNKSTFAPT